MDFHRQGPRPFLYAHRGAVQNAPENTLLAFTHAFDQGADGVELDVRLCATGEVVVFHDPTFKRLCGDNAEVLKTPWAGVKQRDLGHGQRVPTLDDALDLVVARNGILNIEIKGDWREGGLPKNPVVSKYAANVSAAVAKVLKKRSAADRARCMVSSFNPVSLMTMSALRIGPLALIFDMEHSGAIRGPVGASLLRPAGLHPEPRFVTKENMKKWKARGAYVNPWTIDDPGEARRLLALGVDGFITDNVPALRNL